MKVLITGSEGFVAGEFRRWFAANRPDDQLTLTDITEPYRCDVRTFFASRWIDTRFDLVIHLAAVVGGRATIEGDPMAVATDLAIDADLWQWCLRTRPGRVVYFSSSAAYPVAMQKYAGMKLAETDIKLGDVRSPDLTYGWAKLTGEIQAKLVREAGIPTLVLRPFSGYGPTQSLDYPWPSIVARVRAREDPLEIWSDTTRDFIHITDVVAATMAMVDAEVDDTVNLCTGVGTSFRGLARMLADAAGYTPEIRVLSDKPAGVSYRVGDPTRMLRYYTPTISLERSIKEAV